VADYPFTTVVPNLGVVDVNGRHQFVAVDIPGLIEGAHAGKGLGDRFLRHVERTRVLIHMVDLAAVEGRDPLDDYHRINEELTAFSGTLRQRGQIVAGNKIDLLDETAIAVAEERFAAAGIKMLPISVVSGKGVQELVRRTHRVLQTAPMEERTAVPRRRVYRFRGEEGFRVDREGNVFTVRGEVVETLVKKLALDSRDACEYLSERLEKMGVLRELSRQGFSEGDLVCIGGVELELGE